MNYYAEIKEEIINNEITKRIKDYSKNRSDLDTYYKVGKLLSEAGKHYGEGIIREYSKKLTMEFGKKYSITTLKYIRQFYYFSKSHSLSDQLTYTHYKILLSLKSNDKINYYIKISIDNHLSVRELKSKIKNNEYERLDDDTKLKLITKEEYDVKDYSKNRSDLDTYYKVGKLLSEAGKHYGEGIIREYSKKLTMEFGKGYTQSRLRYFRRFYDVFSKCPTLSDELSYSHYCEIIWYEKEN